MLESQNGGRHHNRGLFSVTNSFKGCTYGDFCFSKTYIAANQPIHGRRLLHIFFNIGRCFTLIGCVFVHKRSLQFCLQITVGRMRIPFLRFTLRIQLDKIESDFLDFGFRFFFESLPYIAAQFIDLGHSSFLAGIFRDFVQRVDVDIEYITVFVDQANGFLHNTVDINFL